MLVARAYPTGNRCSFCGRSREEVWRLFAGPNFVYICDDCIFLSWRVLEDDTDAFVIESTIGKLFQAYCVFCGQKEEQVEQLVTWSERSSTFICNECIGRMYKAMS